MEYGILKNTFYFEDKIILLILIVIIHSFFQDHTYGMSKKGDEIYVSILL